MKCPACSAQLKTMMAGDIELDVCEDGCGGIWFDRNELFKFDEPHEFNTHPVIELAKKKSAVHIDHSKVKECPKCPEEKLVRQFFDVKNEVELDICWACGGAWLDVGEINTVREQYNTTEDRKAAADEYIDTCLEAAKKDMDETTAQRIKEYNEQTATPLKAALYSLKSLLNLDDLYDHL